MIGLAEWDAPDGGMFLWMRINGVSDVWDMVMDRGLRKNVMLVPGHPFMADPLQPCPYIRLSYSIAPMDQIDVVRILSKVLYTKQIPKLT